MPCYQVKSKIGPMFICGDLGEHCSSCSDVGLYLCDFPVGDNKTCDLHLCDDHAHEVAPNLHYCDAHFKMWEEFRKSGGVKHELENVVPYKIGD